MHIRKIGAVIAIFQLTPQFFEEKRRGEVDAAALIKGESLLFSRELTTTHVDAYSRQRRRQPAAGVDPHF
jgi:hypothetical protein